MKKIVLFCLIIVVLLMFVGCTVRIEKTEEPISTEVILPEENNIPEEEQNNENKEVNIEVEEEEIEYILSDKIAYVNYADFNSILHLGCLNWETMTVSSVRHLPVFKVGSTQELEAFYERSKGILVFNRGYEDCPSFDNVVENYTEDFFKENMIVFAYVEASSGSARFGILNVGMENNTLCLNIEQTYYPEVGTADMAGWIVIHEMKKADVQDIEDYDAVFVYTMPENIEEDLGYLPGMIGYGEFSFEEYLKDLDMTSDKVKTDGFVNVEGREIQSADLSPVERAKFDTSQSYDFSDYYYDGDTDMWMVRFWNVDTVDNKEVIFLDGFGFTVLIVQE